MMSRVPTVPRIIRRNGRLPPSDQWDDHGAEPVASPFSHYWARKEQAMKRALSLTLILCLAGSALPAAAQEQNATTQAPVQSTETDTWLDPTRLVAGEDIRIVLVNSTSYRGVFRMADDQSITLMVAGHEQRVTRASVSRISVARGMHRRRNVLLGLVIGATAGGLVLAFHCRGEASSCKEWAPVYVNPAAGVAAGIGALLPARDWQTIYEARGPKGEK
jgi:hypothetical protein